MIQQLLASQVASGNAAYDAMTDADRAAALDMARYLYGLRPSHCAALDRATATRTVVLGLVHRRFYLLARRALVAADIIPMGM